MVSCHEIEQAVYEKFTAGEKLFEAVDLGKFPASLRPGMNVAVTSGTWKRQSTNSFKAIVQVVMVIAVKNIANETERRRVIHPLVHAVYRSMVGATLLAGLDQIEPGPWDDRTTVAEFQSGITKFQLSFTTAMTLRIDSGSEADLPLESLIAEYSAMQDPQSAGIVVATDEVSV